MNRREIHIISACLGVILLLFTTLTGYGQQPDIPTMLKEKFDRFVRRVPWEDVYVHTDRQAYIAGEITWMKVYSVDRQSSMPATGSRIAWVEILNSGNRPVAQTRILLEAGCGSGSFRLPDTLSTGTYLLRAYTGRMRNFLPGYCFMQEIRISNALDLSCSREMTTASPPEGKLAAQGSRTQTGFGLRFVPEQQNGTAVQFTVDIKGRQTDTRVWLCIQSHGRIHYLTGHDLAGDSTLASIPQGVLHEGVNQLTLFNAKGEPVAETYVFIPGRKIEDGRTAQTLETGIRQNISISTDELPVDKSTVQYSVSVAPSAVSAQTGLKEYLVLGSEFGYQPDMSAKLLRGDTAELSLTSGWIDWEAILSDRLPAITWPAETGSHFMEGRLFYGDRPAPSGQFVLLCIPGKEAQFQAVQTGNRGEFMFSLPVDEAVRDLVLLPDDILAQPRISVESGFPALYPVWEETDSVGSMGMAIRQSVNYQVHSIYRIPPSGDPVPARARAESKHRFYGKPDIELKMSDYILLPVMQEVFAELLPDVSLKRKKDDVAVEIIRRDASGLVFTAPCLMVDGVVVKDPAVITGIDPETVEKIDVVKASYVVGEYRFPGIVNVITKSGDFSVISQPAWMSRMSYRVIDPVRQFPEPDYSTPGKRMGRVPDYRNTLLWNPGLTLPSPGKAIEFTTSDNPGEYLFRLEGITPDGQILSIIRHLHVK